MLSAMMGFEKGENLFIENGKWRSSYIPIDIRRQPFQACVVDKSKPSSMGEVSPGDNIKIGLDVSSNRLNEELGEPLFNDDETISDYVQSVSNALSSLLASSQATKEFLSVLSEK